MGLLARRRPLALAAALAPLAPWPLVLIVAAAAAAAAASKQLEVLKAQGRRHGPGPALPLGVPLAVARGLALAPCQPEWPLGMVPALALAP